MSKTCNVMKELFYFQKSLVLKWLGAWKRGPEEGESRRGLGIKGKVKSESGRGGGIKGRKKVQG